MKGVMSKTVPTNLDWRVRAMEAEEKVRVLIKKNKDLEQENMLLSINLRFAKRSHY